MPNAPDPACAVDLFTASQSLMEVEAGLDALEVAGRHLKYRTIASTSPDRPWLVFLHEGLGCASMWRDFPDVLAAATGCPALVYSRSGYGGSNLVKLPREPDYMHREALEVLPALLAALGIERPILYGHSDGASIALIHAGSENANYCALVLEAPHLFVEDISLSGVRDARQIFETTDLPQKLARYHANPEHTFRGWHDIWLDPAFRAWNIEASARNVECPTLALQGLDDNYGTLAQIDALQACARQTRRLILEGCGHSPHREQRDTVVAEISSFIASL